eukprot:TRINITY_DN8062_c0_g1_i6.p1 TRINITY_DN8062_c0_g1~~TRINITY_DN8062_c0_g1_i6.p1  ORF type:complete len:490 (-),score=77.51 TRINITY_DN8062_c0_g1_i6:23-1492(-)
MRRYQWTLKKTLEFLESRVPNLKIRRSFIRQLNDYEHRLKKRGIGPMTSEWTEVYDKSNDFENEELLLRNTYLNAQTGPPADFSDAEDCSQASRIRWVDCTKKKTPLSTIIGTDKPAKKKHKPASVMKSLLKNNKKHVKCASSTQAVPGKKITNNKAKEEKVASNRKAHRANSSKFASEPLNKISVRKLNEQRITKADSLFYGDSETPSETSVSFVEGPEELSTQKSAKKQSANASTRYIKNKTNVSLEKSKERRCPSPIKKVKPTQACEAARCSSAIIRRKETTKTNNSKDQATVRQKVKRLVQVKSEKDILNSKAIEKVQKKVHTKLTLISKSTNSFKDIRNSGRPKKATSKSFIREVTDEREVGELSLDESIRESYSSVRHDKESDENAKLNGKDKVLRLNKGGSFTSRSKKDNLHLPDLTVKDNKKPSAMVKQIRKTMNLTTRNYSLVQDNFSEDKSITGEDLSLIHICRCRRYAVCRSRWSPYH